MKEMKMLVGDDAIRCEAPSVTNQSKNFLFLLSIELDF